MTFVKEVLPTKREKLSAEAKKKASEKVEAARKEDSKMVKGVFTNRESSGGDLTFAYRGYKGDPIRVYHFIDGEEYTIPLGVARHINRQCKYTKSAHLVDKNGKPMIGAGKPVQRYEFISTDFM